MAKSKETNKEKYERYYNAGWYNEEMLWNMVVLCQDLVQVKMRNFSPF